jgi:inner membrane protein involved in colicin E2 resistance
MSITESKHILKDKSRKGQGFFLFFLALNDHAGWRLAMVYSSFSGSVNGTITHPTKDKSQKNGILF